MIYLRCVLRCFHYSQVVPILYGTVVTFSACFKYFTCGEFSLYWRIYFISHTINTDFLHYSIYADNTRGGCPGVACHSSNLYPKAFTEVWNSGIHQ